ncbi:Rad52/Rad22 family DNA repair protein [Paenibacillus agricola]|uniref:Uncharacterized protein n=1 Tax=Paenibacillus agricola TaxID=2716264 RepID=A0ABX0J9U2_9BACL|nr:Rad52/Rad22 family DNA repair protein [Paenibacillus agricola]NHN33149.1 hypothetical protein [Paenibacillus agricola]
MNITENTFDILNAPFHYDDYSVNHDGYVFVSPQATSDRLNQIFTPQGWKLEVIEQIVDMQYFTVSILGKIAIRSGDEWIEKSQFGDATMVIQRGKAEPIPQAILNAKKIALSDCLKKCASLIGIASDIYRGKLMVLGNKTSEYLQMAGKFRLDTNKKQFKNGIVLLPDHYKSYYEKNNWNGIFASDLQSLSSAKGNFPKVNLVETKNSTEEELERLKNKYKEGIGSLDGFDTWMKHLANKGMDLSQMDFVLQEAINKRSKTHEEELNKGRETDENNNLERTSSNNDSSQSVHSGEQKINGHISSHMNGILKDCFIEGEGQPYFKLLFDFKGIATEVYAVGPLMEEVEKLEIRQGDKYHVSTREAKGRNLLREIRMAG